MVEPADLGKRRHTRARQMYELALLAGMLASALGIALAAPNVIVANGWGVDHGERVQTATLPAPLAALSTSDLLNGQGTMAAVPSPASDGPVNGVDFDIVVPSLGYRATVREGTGASVLARGPGHYTTTAWPGEPGNVGIAAHNTYWLGFGNLRPGDPVEIETRSGAVTYVIRDIRVVNPDDRTVLAGTADQRLTMTTCYPLWAGAFATQRLIFTAIAVGAVG